MKKITKVIVVAAIAVVVLGGVSILKHANTESRQKECRKVIDGFEYQYTVQGDEAWIQNIRPLGDKDLSVLKIPSKLGGKAVTKLGDENDRFDKEESTSGNTVCDIFGEKYMEDSTAQTTYIYPDDVHDRVADIQEIYLPDTLKYISFNAFRYVQDGKSLYFSAPIHTELKDTGLLDVVWEKLVLPEDMEEYQVLNGCLCSKNGTDVYGIAENAQKVSVPEGTKTLTMQRIPSELEELVIPASVEKISLELPYNYAAAQNIDFNVSGSNPRYAGQKGALYDKTKGKLLIASIQDGSMTIPESISMIDQPVVLGDGTKLRTVKLSPDVLSVKFSGYDDDRIPYYRRGVNFVIQGDHAPKFYDKIYQSNVVSASDIGKKDLKQLKAYRKLVKDPAAWKKVNGKYQYPVCPYGAYSFLAVDYQKEYDSLFDAPKSLLADMSTEELFEFVMRNPVANSLMDQDRYYAEGIEYVAKRIPALRILLNREDLYQTVIKYYKKYQIPADASGIKCEMNYPSENDLLKSVYLRYTAVNTLNYCESILVMWADRNSEQLRNKAKNVLQQKIKEAKDSEFLDELSQFAWDLGQDTSVPEDTEMYLAALVP